MNQEGQEIVLQLGSRKRNISKKQKHILIKSLNENQMMSVTKFLSDILNSDSGLNEKEKKILMSQKKLIRAVSVNAQYFDLSTKKIALAKIKPKVWSVLFKYI